MTHTNNTLGTTSGLTIKGMRNKLVKISLEWERRFGVAPPVTSSISEYDAARLVGMSESAYSKYMKNRTAVSKGNDFDFNGKKYQVKANRPSGKKGSFVTRVPKARNYQWDKLIWNYMTSPMKYKKLGNGKWMIIKRILGAKIDCLPMIIEKEGVCFLNNEGLEFGGQLIPISKI